MALHTITFTVPCSFRELQRVVDANRDYLTEKHVVRMAYKLYSNIKLYVEFCSQVPDCAALGEELLQHLSAVLHCSVSSLVNREWIKTPPNDALDILLVNTNSNFRWQPLLYDDYNVLGADQKIYRENSDEQAFDFTVARPLTSFTNDEMVCSGVIFTPVTSDDESKRVAMWSKWMGNVSSDYEQHGRDLVAEAKPKNDNDFCVLFSKQSIMTTHWISSVLVCKFTKLVLTIIPKFVREVICNEWVDRRMINWTTRQDYISRKYCKSAEDVQSMKWLFNYFMFSSTTHSFWHHFVATYNICDRFGACLCDLGAPHMSALEMHRRLIRMEKMRYSMNSVILTVAQSGRNIFESNEDTDDARAFVSVLKSIAADKSNSETLRSMVMKMIAEQFHSIRSNDTLDEICVAMLKNRANALECVFPIVDEFTWGCTQLICLMSGFPITSTTQFANACSKAAARLHAMNELVASDIRSTCMYGILMHFWLTYTYDMYERVFHMYRELGMGIEPVFRYASVHDQRDRVIRAHEVTEHVGCLYTDKTNPDKRRFVSSVYTSIHALVAGFPVRDAMGFISGDPNKWRLASEVDICEKCLRNYAVAQPHVVLQRRREAVLEYESVEREIVLQTQPAFMNTYELLVKYRRFVSALFSQDRYTHNQTRCLPMTSSMYKVNMIPYSFQGLRSAAIKYNALTFDSQNPKMAAACVTACVAQVAKPVAVAVVKQEVVAAKNVNAVKKVAAVATTGNTAKKVAAVADRKRKKMG